MKVKMLENMCTNRGFIKAGDILEVMQPVREGCHVVVTEGRFAGLRVSHDLYKEVKTYSEEEWNKLLQERDRAREMVDALTKQLGIKNKEIELLNFFMEMSVATMLSANIISESLVKLSEHNAN